MNQKRNREEVRGKPSAHAEEDSQESTSDEAPEKSRKKWLYTSIALACVIVLLVCASVFWLAQNKNAPAAEASSTIPVPLSINNVPEKLSLGVVVSLTSSLGQGAEWRDAAAGAQVAAFRLKLSGTEVSLRVVDDQGTAAGALAATESLLAEGVSGIIVGTRGSHIQGIYDAARATQVPIIAPYETDPQLISDNTWLTGPTAPALESALAKMASNAGPQRTLIVDAGGGIPQGINVAETIEFAPGADPAELTRSVAGLVNPPEPAPEDAQNSEASEAPQPQRQAVDSIVVSGPAEQQAVVINAIQGARATVPIWLTTEATSPAFPVGLAQAGGNLSGSFGSVGMNSGDAVALQTDTTGQARSAFLAGLRLLASDSKAQGIAEDRPFAASAYAADTRSHDAVVALVQAAASAGSKEPSKVAQALSTLQLGYDQGLVGSALDFSSTVALANDQVIGLQSSNQKLGLRPVPQEGTSDYFWFAEPQD